MKNICPMASRATICKPEIDEEIDRPFCHSDAPADIPELIPVDIPTLMGVNHQLHQHAMDEFKNTIGKHLLYGCFGAVVLASIADSIFHPDSSILNSAVDLAKIVATTILGYFFGSKSN